MLRLNHHFRTLFFFIATLLLVSCNTEGNSVKENIIESENPKEEIEVIPEVELFERLDVLVINQSISEMGEVLNPTQIMKLYYPTEQEFSEGKESVEIKENALEHEEMEVVLIHDNLMDDSVKGFKYVMVLKQQKEQWKVVSLKRNWKCHKGRGHSFWGIDSCD